MIKNLLYLALLAATLAKIAKDGAWREYRTKADLALAALGGIMVLAGVVGGSSAALIGEALFVYFRGVIIFYAIRAWRPSWRAVQPLLWLAGVLVAVNVLIALGQLDGRARGFLPHPNDLGHVLGLALLALVASLITVRLAKRWVWWGLLALGSVALGAAQSRQSLVGVAAGLLVLAVLRWRQLPRLALAAAIIVGGAVLPVAMSPDNQGELRHRLTALVTALLRPSGTTQDCDPDHPDCPDREIRVLFMQQGGELWAASPLLGYGPGQFGGIVAERDDPQWRLDPRFQEVLGPDGFRRYSFDSVTVDSFWLHLLVEVGALGTLAYLIWLGALGGPLLRAAWAGRRADGVRGSPWEQATWLAGVAALVFAVVVAAWSPALEDPLFPPLLFGIMGYAWISIKMPIYTDIASRSASRSRCAEHERSVAGAGGN